VKTEEDVDRLLSIPYIPAAPSMESFREIEATVGNRGIMMADVNDPMVMVATVMCFSDYIMLMATNRKKFRALLDMFAERIGDWLDAALEAGTGPLFRIVGPELCTPPYMRPDDFREFVVEYDRPLIDKIHRAGQYARVHCHGNIAKVADMILEMEPDAIDPLEEPPGGDIAFDDAVKRLGGSLCLMGNIQESMFELRTPEDVASEVRRIREIGSRCKRFVLMPTATPITVPLPSRVEENIFAYMETGLEQ
jgi:uroporphyrinogen-III decarboxylase